MMKRLLAVPAVFVLLTGCAAPAQSNADLQITGQMPLEYATQFSVDTCADGCSVIHIAADDYLFVPDGCT